MGGLPDRPSAIFDERSVFPPGRRQQSYASATPTMGIWRTSAAFRGLFAQKCYTLFLQSRCGYACGDRETSLFGHDQPLAGTTELLDSGRTWDLSVNEAKGSPVTRLRLRSSRWTSCHLNLLNGLRIQNDSPNRRVGTHVFQPLGRASTLNTGCAL